MNPASPLIALAQFRPEKGRIEATLELVEARLAEADAASPRPRLVLFPEAALTGYFLEGGVREQARPSGWVFEALEHRYRRAASDPDVPLDVALGFFELADGRVYNSALYATLGGDDPGIRHVHRKIFLPTYGVFQEERFVEAGPGVRAFDGALGRTALLICEDAFHSAVGTLAALDGAELLLVPSASPARGARPGPGVPGNLARWDRLAGGLAAEHGVFVAVSQLVGFEGGKGFAGGSVAYSPRGKRLARGALWEELLLTVRLDREELVSARVEEPLLADLERAWPRLLLHSPGSGVVGGLSLRQRDEADQADGDEPEPGADPRASRAAARDGAAGSSRGDDAPREDFLAGEPEASPPEEAVPAPGDLSPLAIDPALVERWLVHFLRDEVRRRRGFERVVVGMSGGVDSSLTASLAARALGPDSVHGFLLPYRTSSPASAEHARLVAEKAGIETREIEITEAVDGYLERHEPEADDRRRGNVAARQRMIVLFDQAAKLGALPVGTGNKSERLLGYFTWHADDSPPINPLGDLFKVQVWELARAVGLPEAVVEKPATADLIRGQTDEGDLGISYPEADLILHWLLRGYDEERLERHGFAPERIRLVRDRLEGTHWKRHLPTVAMLSSTAIGDWYLRPVDY